jgi:methionine synthase II (cobalamin-independent)
MKGIVMKKLPLIISGLALALGSVMSSANDCVAPDAPQITEGEDSTLEQMLAMQKSVKAFQEANLAYMACLEPMLSAAEADVKEGKEGAAETYMQIQETYNAAVSREEEFAGKFNTEIRDYKAANPG